MAAVIAVVSVIPEVVRTGLRFIKSKFKRSSQFSSRSAFARGSSNYRVVPADDEGLLGSDGSDIGLDDDETADSQA